MRKQSVGFKGLAKTLLAVFAMSLWIPAAFAANAIITNVNVSLNPFYIMVPNANPAPTVNLMYDYDSGGYLVGDITQQIKDKDGNVVYYWGSNVDSDNIAIQNGPVNLVWDGKANNGPLSGEYVATGDYTFYVKSHVNTPPDSEGSKTFKVERTIVPSLNLLTAAPAVYYTGSGNYSINYVYAVGSGNGPVLDLLINGPKNNSPQDIPITDVTKTQDGNYIISWDGKINGNPAPEGDYSYKLSAHNSVNGYTTYSNDVGGSFKVSNSAQPSPTITNVTADPTTFDPSNEDINFSYTLNGSLGLTTVNATVYKSTDLNAFLKSWQFTNQASGPNTITWDGKDVDGHKIGNGNYILKITGSDGNFTLVPQQVSFTADHVATPTPPPPSQETCGGFTDVLKSSEDCSAIEYVKSIGAMTGNPDGTFAPDDILQRDQVAKIALETFNLFNKQNDYCGGVAPFPDVTEAEWSFQYVCRGKSLGMITGYKSGIDAGLYKPARSVNRVEFLALILRNLNENMPDISSTSYSDVAANEWYSGYAKFAKDHNLFTGADLFPTNFVARHEVAEVIYNLHQDGKI